MSEIKHPNLKAELLYLIGRASTPLSSAELYERCELADEIVKVAKAIANLQSDGKIVRVQGEGRARYKLADGVTSPAPAGKAGRSRAVQQDDASTAAPAQADSGTVPESGLPGIDLLAAEVAASLEGKTFEEKKKDASLADAIIARLKRDLGPLVRPPVVGDVEVTTAPGAIHINVQRVDIHISVGLSA